jgi:hypothetical protein
LSAAIQFGCYQAYWYLLKGKLTPLLSLGSIPLLIGGGSLFFVD